MRANYPRALLESLVLNSMLTWLCAQTLGFERNGIFMLVGIVLFASFYAVCRERHLDRQRRVPRPTPDFKRYKSQDNLKINSHEPAIWG